MAVELVREGAIAVLTMNRPDRLNALGLAGDGALFAEACAEINEDSSIRCAILTGAGRAFSAGGDVKALRDKSGGFEAHSVGLRDHYRRSIHRLARALYGLEVPLIAAVNGPAVGLGCDVACFADIRIASTEAKFGATFLKLGLAPGDGGSWLLPRVIGMSRAADLLFTGRLIDAETAERWGLVSEVVPHDRLMARAMERANAIAAMPPHALRLTKNLLRQGQNTSYDTALDMAAAFQALLHLTPDHEEGVAAVIEKRPGRFTGA